VKVSKGSERISLPEARNQWLTCLCSFRDEPYPYVGVTFQVTFRGQHSTIYHDVVQIPSANVACLMVRLQAASDSDAHVCWQVPYNYTNAAFIPAERPTGLNNDNFRCVLQPGLYQVRDARSGRTLVRIYSVLLYHRHSAIMRLPSAWKLMQWKQYHTGWVMP
jgi:hypothetical protein